MVTMATNYGIISVVTMVTMATMVVYLLLPWLPWYYGIISVVSHHSSGELPLRNFSVKYKVVHLLACCQPPLSLAEFQE